MVEHDFYVEHKDTTLFEISMNEVNDVHEAFNQSPVLTLKESVHYNETNMKITIVGKSIVDIVDLAYNWGLNKGIQL